MVDDGYVTAGDVAQSVALWLLRRTTSLFTSAATIWLLWGWFISPLGLPVITPLHALGIYLFVSWLVPNNFVFDTLRRTAEISYRRGQEPVLKWDNMWHVWLTEQATAWIACALGAVIQSWM